MLGPALPIGRLILADPSWIESIDQQPVRVLMVLERPDGGELITWTPVCRRFEAQGILRDFAAGEWYDTPNVGWDACDDLACWDHTLRVKRALIVDQAEDF